MGQVHIRTRARRDILAGADYLENEGGIEVADRFLSAARISFEALAQNAKGWSALRIYQDHHETSSPLAGQRI